MSEVAGRLAATAARAPDVVALHWRDREITYAALDAAADRGAGALRDRGVAAGDRVALVAGNVPGLVEAFYATLRAGAVAVPLDRGLAPDELAHALRDSGARVAIAAPGPAAAIAERRAELPALDHLIVFGSATESYPSWRMVVDEAEPAPAVTRAPDDLAVLMYTSGTTGRPRGAMLTDANLVANQDQAASGRFQLETGDGVLLVLPLTHLYALNVGLGVAVHAGATLLLVERFEPTSTLGLIHDREPRLVLGTPSMYTAWEEASGFDDRDWVSTRLAVSGAAPLGRDLFERFERRFGVKIDEGYGLTEAGPAVTSNVMAPAPRAGSVGLPLPGVEIRLVDDHGADVEPGDPGEVWVRGPNVFAGYWNDREATQAALAADGWLRTGDVGTCDADGYLYLVDRQRDVIIVNGFNVYPAEVERALETHDDVVTAAAIGVPHPYTGESVRAFVTLVDGSDVSEEDLIEHCRGWLARYKCPSSVRVVDALPLTAIGKVRRTSLRDVTA